MKPTPLPKLKNRIAVIAHRGGAALAPENTSAAFRNAIQLGCDYVEIDVRTTRDGKLVIMHDRTVDRTTDGTGAVNELDFATIRKLDAGVKFSARYKGEKVPTLEEVLSLCRDKINVYIDHKDAPSSEIIRTIRRTRMEKQVVVYGSVEKLKEWKRLAPHIPVMTGWREEFAQPGGIAAFRKELPAEVLDGNAESWTAQAVNEAHALGVKVYVDNLGLSDTLDGYRRSLEMGVDGIQTDHPDDLIKVLKQL